MRAAEAHLAAVVERFTPEGIAVGAILHYVESAAAILRGLAAEKADLLALSSQGRSGLRRPVTDSVAGEVVRKGRVSVLLLHGHERQPKSETGAQ